jgi:hypothetical protein
VNHVPVRVLREKGWRSIYAQVAEGVVLHDERARRADGV